MPSRTASFGLAVVACALLASSLSLPLWQMRMEAPQYRDDEALGVRVYAGKFEGDLGELGVLNSYIGVHVPKDLPQFSWLPAALIAAGALGIVAAWLPRAWRRCAFVVIPAALSLGLLVAAAQAQWQMHRIGHERDKKTTMVGVKDFTPPLLGRAKVAQFTLTSFFHWGAGLVGLALLLQCFAAWVNRAPAPPPGAGPPPQPA